MNDPTHIRLAEAPEARALRMVAAAEYFKAVGELPSWARAELESWNSPAEANRERPSSVRAIPHSTLPTATAA